jgi:hypothetical protein
MGFEGKMIGGDTPCKDSLESPSRVLAAVSIVTLKAGPKPNATQSWSFDRRSDVTPKVFIIGPQKRITT